MKISVHFNLTDGLMPRLVQFATGTGRIRQGLPVLFSIVIRHVVLIFGLCSVDVSLAEPSFLTEEVQVHGFLTQGFFHSSDNNVYGQSDDGISPGLTEIGLNINYQPWDRLRFAAQGLYRRAGDVDTGSVRLDYGLADLTLLEHDDGKLGLRAGRVKIPFGLYNENPRCLVYPSDHFVAARHLL